MLYLVHAGVGDVVLLRLQDNGGVTATLAPMGVERGDAHGGTPGCWLRALHLNNTYLEWWGDGMALLGHPAALGTEGLWVPGTLPWGGHPWLGGVHGRLPPGWEVLLAGDASRWCEGVQGCPWRFLGERRAPPQPLTGTPGQQPDP